MRRGTAIATVLFFFAGCGGSDTPTAAQPPADQGPLLDFSAIAGQWAGWGVESFPDGRQRTSWIVLDVDESAREGELVGTFTVGTEGANGQLVEDCALNLFAESADPPAYRFTASIAGCTDAMVEIEHDTDVDVLFADVTAVGNAFTASHVLEPGTDPGESP